MSALSFKINAETDKLNSFIASLERLKQVLATIPSGTKEFDVVNQKIAEMEARVEQSIKRITQMQNEAAKTTTQTAASPTTPAGSATGIQAANAEAEAWRGLLDELKAANDAKSKAMIELKQYQNEVSRLKTEVALLNKEEQQTGQLSSKKRGQLLSASMSIEEYKQRISRLRRELANQIKLEQAATGSIDEMSQALARMRTIYRSLDEGERGSTFGQNLLKNIQALDTKIKELDASMGVHARNVGNYAFGWNGLSFSIQQVARELPSLAISPQTFFLAISNNLPILADQLALTRQRVKELKAEGQSFTPVWKQVIKSIISWQTLLVAGITVLTLYGKEITEWVGSLFKGKQAILDLTNAMDKISEAADFSDAGKQIADFQKLAEAYRNLGDSAKDKTEFISKYKSEIEQMGVSVESIAEADNLFITNSGAFIQSIQQRAMALAGMQLAAEKYQEALKKSVDNAGKLPKLKNTIEKFKSHISDLEDKKEQKGDPEGWIKTEITATEAEINRLVNKIRDLSGEIAKEAGDTFVKAANEMFANAESILISAEIDNKEDGESGSQQAKNLQELNAALRKLRYDALQAEIDSMRDGTEKRVAQIELDYQRRAEAINEAEQRIIELQGKLTQKQEEQFAQLRQVNDNRRKNERHEAIAGPPIDTNFAEYWKKEQADWDEYYMKYGTFREKMQATKDYYDRKMAEATTEGARAAIQAERDAALAVFEVQASDWAKEIVNLSVKNLEELLSEAEAQLAAAEAAYDALASSGTQEAAGYIDTINKLKARIAVLKSLLGKTKKEVSDSNWAEGARLLNELSATAREAANALSEFDEGLGKAATFIATMASAAGNLIATIEGVTDAASAAGAEMSALEKASVVLTAISAGFQLIQGVFSLFGGGESSWERNIRLAHEFNEELRLMNERVKINAEEFSSIFGKDEYGAFIQNIEVARKALKDYEESLEEIKKRGEEKNGFPGEGTISYTGLSQLYKYEKEWESAAESIANMQVQTRHSTWFRSAKYASLGDLIPELFDENGSLNMEALKKFAEEGGATFQHLSGENQEMIQNLVANWDTYQEALEASNNYLSDLFNNLGNTLADALVDAWESGADAADAFGEAAGDMLKQLAKDIITRWLN